MEPHGHARGPLYNAPVGRHPDLPIGMNDHSPTAKGRSPLVFGMESEGIGRQRIHFLIVRRRG